MILTEIERQALQSFIATNGTLLTAVQKFAQKKRADMEREASDCMRYIPRRFEQASDYAAKAEAYSSLLGDLERFANNSEPEVMA